MEILTLGLVWPAGDVESRRAVFDCWRCPQDKRSSRWTGTALPETSHLVVASALRCPAAAAETSSEEPEKAIANLPNAIAQGVSTTLLQGLEAMTEDAPSAAVEFTVSWDLQLPPVDSPTAVRLEPPQLQRVPRLNRELRASPT